MTDRLVWLALALLVSAIAVVALRHETRRLYGELAQLQAERDALNVEWGKLLLEEGAWSQHRRLEALARVRLDMELPGPGRIAVIRVTETRP
jgi:cell division protein FtsL